MENFKSFLCVECFAGKVNLICGHNIIEYSDVKLSVPDDFEIPTCENCGERYFSVELEARLMDLQKK